MVTVFFGAAAGFFAATFGAATEAFGAAAGAFLAVVWPAVAVVAGVTKPSRAAMRQIGRTVLNSRARITGNPLDNSLLRGVSAL